MSSEHPPESSHNTNTPNPPLSDGTPLNSVPFHPPPVTTCICAPSSCLSLGRKLHSPTQICSPCLLRHDLRHLHHSASDNPIALDTISTETTRRQTLKSNLEAHGRFLCAFEDPDYYDCAWRAPEFNLKDARVECKVVKMKGQACPNCWRGYLRKVGVVQFFTPWGVCHEGVGAQGNGEEGGSGGEGEYGWDDEGGDEGRDSEAGAEEEESCDESGGEGCEEDGQSNEEGGQEGDGRSVAEEEEDDGDNEEGEGEEEDDSEEDSDAITAEA